MARGSSQRPAVSGAPKPGAIRDHGSGGPAMARRRDRSKEALGILASTCLSSTGGSLAAAPASSGAGGRPRCLDCVSRVDHHLFSFSRKNVVARLDQPRQLEPPGELFSVLPATTILIGIQGWDAGNASWSMTGTPPFDIEPPILPRWSLHPRPGAGSGGEDLGRRGNMA